MRSASKIELKTVLVALTGQVPTSFINPDINIQTPHSAIFLFQGATLGILRLKN